MEKKSETSIFLHCLQNEDVNQKKVYIECRKMSATSIFLHFMRKDGCQQESAGQKCLDYFSNLLKPC